MLPKITWEFYFANFPFNAEIHNNDSTRDLTSSNATL